MNQFLFDEAQEMFRTELRRFGQKELAPGIQERAKQAYYPHELIKKIADMGVLGLNIPAKYGGQDADSIMIGIAIEELGRADSDVGLPIILSAMMGFMLKKGSEELQEEWLPAIASGEKIPCLGMTEAEAGSDLVALKTTAVKDDDHYILNGEKNSTTFGVEADVFVLLAKTDPAAGVRGISAFLVPLDFPGVSRTVIPDLGWESVARATIALEDVRIPARYLIGEEGRGFHILMEYLDISRVLLTLAALGAAEASLDDAISYAKQRTAFGQPISNFQAVSFKIAEHATLIEAAKLLSYQALWLKDHGLPHTKEAAMCKWFVAQVAVNAIHDILLIHGHYGYSQELPLELRLRNAIGFELSYGTAEVMKIIIARELMKT
jgi:cyclohexanecarboxyl-CoA dehydrogenase